MSTWSNDDEDISWWFFTKCSSFLSPSNELMPPMMITIIIWLCYIWDKPQSGQYQMRWWWGLVMLWKEKEAKNSSSGAVAHVPISHIFTLHSFHQTFRTNKKVSVKLSHIDRVVQKQKPADIKNPELMRSFISSRFRGMMLNYVVVCICVYMYHHHRHYTRFKFRELEKESLIFSHL